MKESLGFTLLTALASVTIACSGVQARCITGMQLNEAEKQDFFQFFRFKETDRQAVSRTETMVMYSTGVGKHAVKLGVIVRKDRGDIVSMALVLPRRFVNDKKYGIFARDISKSFLQAAIPDPDADAFKPLVSEISFADQQNWKSVDVKAGEKGQSEHDVTMLKPGTTALKKGDNVWLNVKSVPELPKQPTAGYLTYKGQKEAFEEQYSHCRFRIKNGIAKVGDAKVQELMLSVWAASK